MPDGHDTSTASDEQIITATLGGDVSSFGIIVERYWDMVIAFALSKIDNAIDAEDIAQESFLKAYSQLHRLRNPSRFAGWLSKIVAQQCVNHIRKNAHKRIASSYTTYDVDASAQAVACNNNPGLTDLNWLSSLTNLSSNLEFSNNATLSSFCGRLIISPIIILFNYFLYYGII